MVKIGLSELTLAMESSNSQSQGQKSKQEDALRLLPGELLAFTQGEHLPKLDQSRVSLI